MNSCRSISSFEICVNFSQNMSRLFSMFDRLHFFRGTFGLILTQSLLSLFVGSWSSSRVWLLLSRGENVKLNNKVRGKLQEKCSWSVPFLVTYTSSKNYEITMMMVYYVLQCAGLVLRFQSTRFSKLQVEILWTNTAVHDFLKRWLFHAVNCESAEQEKGYLSSDVYKALAYL